MDVLFSVTGRIKRLTFWEGLATWVVINVFCLVCFVSLSATPLNYYLMVSFGDTENVFYHGLIWSVFFLYWIFSLWIFLALSIKRWHDLSFPGWLAVINALPVLITGAAFLVFLWSAERNTIRSVMVDGKSSPFVLWAAFVKMYSHAETDTWHFWHTILSLAIVVAVFLYAGLAKGDARSNNYGKTSL